MVGLGAWRSRAAVYVGEYGSLLVGLAIYALAHMRSDREEEQVEAKPRSRLFQGSEASQ